MSAWPQHKLVGLIHTLGVISVCLTSTNPRGFSATAQGSSGAGSLDTGTEEQRLARTNVEQSTQGSMEGFDSPSSALEGLDPGTRTVQQQGHVLVAQAVPEEAPSGAIRPLVRAKVEQSTQATIEGFDSPSSALEGFDPGARTVQQQGHVLVAQAVPEEAPSGAIGPLGVEPEEPEVPISEVFVTGLEGHPDQERLEALTYDTIKVRSGQTTTLRDLQGAITELYATGWFSDARITPSDSPLGVRLEVAVVPNPVLKKVVIENEAVLLPASEIEKVFAPDYGNTLNLNQLDQRLNELQDWYSAQGYVLARVTGPTRISPAGLVSLAVREGIINEVLIEFVNAEGDSVDPEGNPVKGKTRDWVVSREVGLLPGSRFNRQLLEEDIRRLYQTGLYRDIKASLQPVVKLPGSVDVVLKIEESQTGSLSGGIGYSAAQGIYGQAQFGEENLFGRAWKADAKVSYGQYGSQFDISFIDPWIKGDSFRTSMRMNAYYSRSYPAIFRAGPHTKIKLINNTDEPQSAAEISETSSSVMLSRTGGDISFSRPLNGGNPFQKAAWTLTAGINFQLIDVLDSDLDSKRYGAKEDAASTDQVLCVAYNCSSSNTLTGFRLGATYNSLDSNTRPTQGDYVSLATSQYISVGENSPTYNKFSASYAHFIPVRLLNFTSGCNPKEGEKEDCPQTIVLSLSAGGALGELPPYDAFCLGGVNSVRGYESCGIGGGKYFSEVTAEYRFPIWNILSGEIFFDAGTSLGSQSDVIGNPAGIRNIPESGYSPGIGVIVATPLGPLRLELATEEFDIEKYRFNFGVGFKF